MTDNMPTVRTTNLTALTVANAFFKAMLHHDFETPFVAGLRAAVRAVEMQDSLNGNPTPLQDDPTAEWDRTTSWHPKIVKWQPGIPCEGIP